MNTKEKEKIFSNIDTLYHYYYRGKKQYELITINTYEFDKISLRFSGTCSRNKRSGISRLNIPLHYAPLRPTNKQDYLRLNTWPVFNSFRLRYNAFDIPTCVIHYKYVIK